MSLCVGIYVYMCVTDFECDLPCNRDLNADVPKKLWGVLVVRACVCVTCVCYVCVLRVHRIHLIGYCR